MSFPSSGFMNDVRLCDRCESEFGKGLADEVDLACSTCGTHDAPHVYLGEITDEMIERAARALVREQSQGCVSWEDTDDTDTSGDAMTRNYARQNARVALAAAFSTTDQQERS